MDHRTGCIIALASKIQGSRCVTAENFLPFAVRKIELFYFAHRLKIAHRHRIVRSNDDAVRTDNLNQIVERSDGMNDGIEVKTSEILRGLLRYDFLQISAERIGMVETLDIESEQLVVMR